MTKGNKKHGNKEVRKPKKVKSTVSAPVNSALIKNGRTDAVKAIPNKF